MFYLCFLGENINTLSRCFVDKPADCLYFYLQTINIKLLCLHMSGYKPSTCIWDSLVMYTVYTNKFTVGQLKLRLPRQIDRHNVWCRNLGPCELHNEEWVWIYFFDNLFTMQCKSHERLLQISRPIRLQLFTNVTSVPMIDT